MTKEIQTRSDGTLCWPARSGQPTTALRGDVAEINFDLYQLARQGKAPYEVQTLFNTFGSYRIKPKRGSRGVIWRNRAFWWSAKGYYRGGTYRRPLQHLIWEACRETIPAHHEIWFKDRDRHNFQLSNLECISKAELHRRTIINGEVRQLNFEERSQIAGKRWTRHARRQTSALLKIFNQQEHNEHITLRGVAARRQKIK